MPTEINPSAGYYFEVVFERIISKNIFYYINECGTISRIPDWFRLADACKHHPVCGQRLDSETIH